MMPFARSAPALALTLIAVAAAGWPAAGAAQELTAIVGAEIRPVSGPRLERGTVLVSGELIRAVGTDVALPEGTRIIDADGRIVTPGLIAADTQIGLLEIGLEPMSNDAQVDVDHPIRAAARADDAFDLASSLVGVARRHGVTTVVSGPSGGLVSGRSGWFDLLDPTDPGASAASSGLAALHVHLGEAGAAAYGGSRALAVARLRGFLEDVQTFRTGRAAFRRRELHELSASRIDLEAAIPAVERKLPVVIEVHRAADIRAVVELVEEYRLEAVLLGVAEGWLEADLLAREEIPVIVDPTNNLPFAFESRNARADNAALMARAGVKVILTARSSHNAGNLRFAVGNAVRAGFPSDLALRAATLSVAEAFGRAKTVGSLEPGRVANLVIWTGDPFEPSSYAERVLVRGREQPTESRQTRLARRYIERLGLR